MGADDRARALVSWTWMKPIVHRAVLQSAGGLRGAARSLAWDTIGQVPNNPRSITLERAGQLEALEALEALGALAGRWRAVRGVLDGAAAGRPAQ